MDKIDYSTVTETTGSKVTYEQLRRMYTRYRFASDFCNNRVVLEVGFGSGQGLGYLAKHARRVVGIEYEKKLLEIAHDHYKDRIELHHMDAQKLTFDPESFDTVIFYEAIYYLLKPEKFILGAYRILRPEGKIIICSANKDWKGFNPSPYSYKYFSANEIFDLLNRNRFRDIRLYGDCKVTNESIKDKMNAAIKRMAVKSHVIPKTMKGKEFLKRIFFGKLYELPSEINDEVAQYYPPIQIPHDVPNKDFKVIFAVGIK